MNKADVHTGAPQSDAVEESSDLQRGPAFTATGHPVHHGQAAAHAQTSRLPLRGHGNVKNIDADRSLVRDSLIQPACQMLRSEPNEIQGNASAPLPLSPLGSLATPSSLGPHKPEQELERAQPHSDRKELITAAPAGHVPMLNMTTEELSADLKKIYGNLANIEAKCITIDAAQAAEPRAPLTNEQWQTLIALHRTLLYDHHDFIMATQHKAATPAMNGLPFKYSMPARMWKHGIHAFLEVLRHRRPESHDYMLAFIYLSYQMIALFLETVPSYKDTWIECLGDLARYRMAIEPEKEAHTAWGGVAARWYTLASDRSPDVGRLYHHLGILERPSLRKLCFFVKSLTCWVPFANARDSLATLCGPFVQDNEAIERSAGSLEARVVTFHALVCSNKDVKTIERIKAEALRLLSEQATSLGKIGPYLAVTNIGSLFERGYPHNPLWRLYMTASSRAKSAGRNMPPAKEEKIDLLSAETFQAQVSSALTFSADFCYKTFDAILHPWEDEAVLKDHLAFIHIMLAWQHSLHVLRSSHENEGLLDDRFLALIDPARVSWAGLATVLNSLAKFHPVNARILAHGREGSFPVSDPIQPLSEDFLIRGLIWSREYHPADHFKNQSEDDGRNIETETTNKLRADRVLWLGLFLAFRARYLHYDEDTKTFSASENFALKVTGGDAEMVDIPRSSVQSPSTHEDTTMKSYSTKRSTSSRSNSDEDFVKVARFSQSWSRPTPRNPSNVARQRDSRDDSRT